jgi:hypothetical protein
MDCLTLKRALLDYHFGTLADGEAADAHLLACKDCLAAYLAMKREIEGEARARPSAAVRERLRAEVMRTFRPGLFARAKAWFVRPMPRYQSVALAAAASALVVMLAIRTDKDGPPPAAQKGGALVDTASRTPDASFYY